MRTNFMKAVALMATTTLMLTSCAGTSPTPEESASAANDQKEDAKQEQQVTLTYAIEWQGPPDSQGPQDSIYYQKYMEATNTDVTFIVTDTEKLSLDAAAQNLPDMIGVVGTNLPGGNISTALNDKIIIPINDLMDAGMTPNLSKLFSENSEIDKLCKTDDGEYWGFPLVREEDSPRSFKGILVRKDWLDELNLDIPETIADWDVVLNAFKERTGGTAPLGSVFSQLEPFRNSFGVTNSFIVEDGTVKFGPCESGYKEYITLFRRWIEEGLIDPDLYAQDGDTAYAKIANGKVGALSGFTGSTLNKIETMKELDPSINYVAAPNPLVEKGMEYPLDESTGLVSMTDSCAFITNTCKNPEAAAKFLDWVYSEEGIILSNYGVEGESYTMVDDDPVLTDLITNNPDGYSLTDSLAIYAGYFKPYIITAKGMGLVYPLEVQQQSLETWTIKDAPIKPVAGVTMTKEETDTFNGIITDMNTYVEESTLQFITGSQSMDNYDTFVENLKKMNIDQAIEIQQAAYDRLQAR